MMTRVTSPAVLHLLSGCNSFNVSQYFQQILMNIVSEFDTSKRS